MALICAYSQVWVTWWCAPITGRHRRSNLLAVSPHVRLAIAVSSRLSSRAGQLDPTNPNTMTLLADVYSDVVEAFQQPSLFHLGGNTRTHTDSRTHLHLTHFTHPLAGGDEVIVGCEDRTCGPSGCVQCPPSGPFASDLALATRANRCVSCWASCWNSSQKAPHLLKHLVGRL